MPKTLIALDLETTGLEPGRDSIIEIGAIRFKGDRTEAEFSTLVNPGRTIPPFITKLTGISDAMVANAPPISAVLPELVDFVGESPIVGHNIGFDLAFMRARRVLRYNDALDTLDLASVLLPLAARYNLASVARELGVVVPNFTAHRALDDCRLTVGVYRALFHLAEALPLNLLNDIVRLGQDVSWGAGLIFEDALSQRARDGSGGRAAGGELEGPLFRAGRERPLAPVPEPTPLDVDALAGVLEHGGAFSQYLPEFEHRSEQVEMLRAVARALSDSRHLLVEAGTGTGKSLGYLIPAIHWAMQNGERVVISTNTINLQDQIINKDLPALRGALNLDFRAQVLKGRSHYLCPRRLENLRRRRPRAPEEMRVLAKVLVWQHQTSRLEGDPPEMSLGPGERSAWMRLSAEDEGCTTDMCQGKQGGACPFYRAHRAAEAAHLVIVNHALLLADIASENRVLPEFRYLILDEAHHLESATTDGLSFHLERPELERQLRDLGGAQSGLLGDLLANGRNGLPPDVTGWLAAECEAAESQIQTALELAQGFFESISHFLVEQRGAAERSEYSQQIRILPGVRTLSHWEQVEVSWDALGQVLAGLAKRLAALRTALDELGEYDFENREDLLAALKTAVRRLADVVDKVNGLVFKPDPMDVYWVEANPGGDRVSLHAAPLHVGPRVQKHLWHAKEAVIMTSATLTTGGEFNYLRGRLNADEADELALGSPFDYESSTLLYLINDIPEPQDRNGHQRAVDQGLIKLCTASRGRALVLFTSYAQLKQTAQAIRDPLAKAGIEVFDQGEGVSRTQLLDSFKTSAGAVLLGTKSFWEGIDVPGEALSVLAIVKLPFDVPNDPIIAARAETFERPFDEYMVPEAVLKFRQGFGRLIRTKSDRGVVAVFDRRLLTKGYGRIFRESLPACTVRVGPLAKLPEEAARWIG